MQKEWKIGDEMKLLKADMSVKSALPKAFDQEAARNARKFHSSLSVYHKTPLVELGTLAKQLGIKDIFVKDESRRFSLNAFKGLGGSYAMFRILCKRFKLSPEKTDMAQFASPKLRDQISRIEFVTATDGNHGRGVSWAAKLFGCRAHIYMPKGSQEVRAEAIRRAGDAEVEITDLSYDDTVRYAKEQSEKHGWILIQDTAWDGYEEIPTWIIEGYLTMASEISDEFDKRKIIPTHVFLQAGVGAMAGGMLAYLRSCYGAQFKAIIVEPDAADCIYESARQADGKAHTVEGSPVTIMAGLNCGTPCKVTWSVLRDYADYYISCADPVAAYGMRKYASPCGTDTRIISGESGAATFGAMLTLLECNRNAAFRQELGIDASSVVLLISTEGDTDPENYRNIVENGAYPFDVKKCSD